jgi:NADPH-dependent 2,4-dienoyl-CoA reductase/sulfur reductase-like enzyme
VALDARRPQDRSSCQADSRDTFQKIEERGMEEVDVVVVGGRLAGCAVAAPLARAGRRVVVLEKMRFPSDQLSTHVLLRPARAS